MNLILHQGNNAEVLRQYPDCHFDAIITDPPYGIEFLGKDWDSHTGTLETWQQCLRVLKPGGHLLAFSAARTYHHLATNIESVGFEIRDQLMWIYSSGFPKAQDIGKALDKRGITNQSHGWKTALKPGHEPIVMARKPMRGSTIDNVLTHGVGALNIDATRISFEGKDTRSGGADGLSRLEFGEREPIKYKDQYKEFVFGAPGTQAKQTDLPTKFEANPKGRYPSNVLGLIPDYQKYFYCPKVSRKERHCGFERAQVPDPLENYSQGDVKNHPLWDPSIGTNLQRLKHKIMEHEKSLGRQHTVTGAVGNNHPTVKPVALMRYLIQLVTPAGSTVLDPFMGSGSTGMAAVELGHTFVGIDLDPKYVEIAERRIQGWVKPKDSCQSTFNELFD